MPVRVFDGVDTWNGYDGSAVPIVIDDPSPFALGFPVYSDADVAAWNSSQLKYAALVSSPLGNSSRTITDMGASIGTIAERDNFRVDSQFALVQAVLGRIDPFTRAARWAKVDEVFAAADAVTSWNTESGKDGLVAGWFGTNLCRAAKARGYVLGSNPGFESFLRNVVHPKLDWDTGGNWLASHWDTRGAIAALLQDETLWDDFMAFGAFHLPQMFYHSFYDEGYVVPCRNGAWPAKATGSINPTKTVRHWGGEFGSPQITESLIAAYNHVTNTPSSGTPFPDGTMPERLRDESHNAFTIAATTHAMRTVYVQNENIPQEWIDRVYAGVDYAAGRVYTYLTTGTLPNPVPFGANDAPLGGTGYKASWYSAKNLLDKLGLSSTNLNNLLTRNEIKDYDVDGDLHMVAEPVADRST